MSKPMKTLELGDTIYEIVDAAVRERVDALEEQSNDMSTSINDEENGFNSKINKINTNIDSINKKIGEVVEGTNLSTKINDVNTRLNTKTQELEAKISNQITNPTVGAVGRILAVKTVDENGKPIEYETIENSGKTAYQYAKEGGYAGTEMEFYVKLAQENPSKEEFDTLNSNFNTLNNNFGTLNSKLKASDETEFRFGVNENGEYGYIITKDGADSVVPFKSSVLIPQLALDRDMNFIINVEKYNHLYIERLSVLVDEEEFLITGSRIDSNEGDSDEDIYSVVITPDDVFDVDVDISDYREIGLIATSSFISVENITIS